MLKLGLEIKENAGTVNINLVDPAKKQLKEATENEKLIAQRFKDLFDEKLVEMLEDYNEK